MLGIFHVMRATVAAVLVLLSCSSAFAHKDRIQHPQTVSVTFSADRSVAFEVATDTVTSIIVRFGQSTFRVPAPTCAKISNVRFETVRLLWDGRAPTPLDAGYFFIAFSAGTENSRSFGELPRIELLFRGGKFTEAHVVKKISRSTSQTSDL